MKLALAQINSVVGDLSGNAEKVLQYCQKAHAQNADLVIFPELTLTGYPPLDLLESEDFVRREHSERERIAELFPQNLGVLIGGLAYNPGPGQPLHNAAYLYEQGTCVGVRHKQLLPTYDVFDEWRYFAPETTPTILPWRGLNLGVHICEDLWNVRELDRKPYAQDPISTLSRQSPDLLINLCASPFAIEKHHERIALMETVSRQYRLPYVFTNLVGANTDLIFDGRSCVLQDGHVLEAPAFEEALLMWDLHRPPTADPISLPPMQQVIEAITLGIRDYVEKTRIFQNVFLGLSGGIDSAVTAALAVRALGSERVVGVSMPSEYSSRGSQDDAQSLASNLGIRLHTIPIYPVVDAFETALRSEFQDHPPGVAEENVQSRVRGTLLMAFANKFDGLVLATGNKSELATGYATLYGDMNGGLSVLGDLYKTEVYELAHELNASANVIPEPSITKPPSAELRPDQTDQDTLPPYEILDPILKSYIEDQASVNTITARLNISKDLVQSITRKVNHTEYKRHQAAPVLRLRKKAFGSGRQEPIVAQRP